MLDRKTISDHLLRMAVAAANSSKASLLSAHLPMGTSLQQVASPPRPPRTTLSSTLSSVDCHLETRELWEKFHELGTEMIITKTGR
jgi:hypothetical protein